MTKLLFQCNRLDAHCWPNMTIIVEQTFPQELRYELETVKEEISTSKTTNIFFDTTL
jgi:hypothetical protein